MFLSKNKTDRAIKCFESALALDPAYRDAYLELYQTYLNQGNVAQAIHTLERAIKSGTSGKPAMLFTLGQLEINNGFYAKASTHFTDYLSQNTRDTLTRAKASLLLSKTQYAMVHSGDTGVIHFIYFNPSINTPAPEYLPSIDAPGTTLVFTRRTNNQEDLYISHLIAGSWIQPQSWSKNSSKNEGAHVISADGKTIVFTGCGWDDSFGGCDLYISEYTLGKWSNPKNFGPVINSKSWESQPSLSSNGRILYFVSDRMGGAGGYDIWMSTKQAKGWTRPINAGLKINTRWDEFSPCLHADGVSLYFRSDGRLGYGSHDIYMTRKGADGKWVEAINLGYPLNDYRDQGAMTVGLDGMTAYYTLQTIRSGNQLMASDIVQFSLPSLARAYPCIYVTGKILDAASGQTLSNAAITIAGGVDLVRKDTVYSDAQGEFLFVIPKDAFYQVHVQASGYNFYSDRINSIPQHNKIDTIKHLIRLEKLEYVDTLNVKPIVLHNVLFDLNAHLLLPESFNELDILISLLNSHPDLHLSIYGHTDASGDPTHNLILSRRRAQAVYDYILSKKIDSNRLSYIGYGDTSPIADNNTEAGREKNRRVEFLLTKKGN